jgi:hypothetical protein
MYHKQASDPEEQSSLKYFFGYAGYVKPPLASTFAFQRLLIC